MFLPMYAFLSTQELLVVGLIVLVLFGGSKIPDLMRGLGSGVKEFKKAASEEPEPDDKPAARR